MCIVSYTWLTSRTVMFGFGCDDFIFQIRIILSPKRRGPRAGRRPRSAEDMRLGLLPLLLLPPTITRRGGGGSVATSSEVVDECVVKLSPASPSSSLP